MRACLLLCVLAACSSDPPDDARYRTLLGPAKTSPDAAAVTVAPPPPPAPPPPSRDMAELLAGIAADRDRHPFFGTAMRDAARAMVQSMPPDVPALARTRALVPLAMYELGLGEVERAVAHLEEARRLAPPKSRTQAAVEFHAAVANLRLGEVRNCTERHAPESCLVPIRGGGVHVDKQGSEAALAGFLRVVEHPESTPPMKLTAGWLTNIAAQTLGRWPDGVDERFRLTPEAYGTGASPRFRNIASTLGLDRMSLAGGAVADDFDGDGDLDLVTSSWDVRARLHYYRNDGGRFVERGIEAGFGGQLGGLNLEHADYDNDGDLDLLVLRGAWLGADGEHPNSLLRNDGRGTFTDVTFAAGLGEQHHPTQAAAFGDYDNDGDLDLYVANEQIPGGKARPAQLFRNDGGRFTDVAADVGVTNNGFGKAAAWGDFDNDDDLDLFVSNVAGPNRLYRNDGGRFVDIAAEAGVTDPVDAFPAWWWDFDNNGHLDLMVWHGFVQSPDAPPVPPVWVVAAHAYDAEHDGQHPALYRGDGRGNFRDVSRAVGLERPILVMGSNHGDLDNDGRPDAYLGTGYPGYEGLTPNVALRNTGWRFADVSGTAGLAHLQKGHGIAFADFDHDGDQDIFAELGGAYLGDAYMDALFENPGTAGTRWLVVELRGTKSNRFGMGVRLRLKLSDGRTLHRAVDNGGSFGGSPWRQQIGLGTADRITELEVYWPTSKIRQRFADLPVDQAIRVTEGTATVERRPYTPTPFRSAP